MALDGGLARLRQAQHLAPSEKKIADFILQDPASFLKMTLAALAAESGSSQAAVVRLWRTLDFAGFHDLKMRVAGDYYRTSSVPISPYQEIEPGSDMATVLSVTQERALRAIQDTSSLAEPSTLEGAVELLLAASRVGVFGVGASGIVAEDFGYKLLRIGLAAMAFRDFHQGVVYASGLGASDVLVCISYSGETTDTLEVAQSARRRGARVIALTQYNRNSLRDLADIPLFVSADESAIRTGAMTSRITALLVLDVIFTAIVSRRFDDSLGYLNASREAALTHRRTMGGA